MTVPGVENPPAPRASDGSAQILHKVAIVVVLLAIAALVGWSFTGVGFSLAILSASSRQHALSTALQFWPPDWSIARKEWTSTLETLQMAIVGTLIGAILAVPLSFFAARTTSFAKLISTLIKTLLNVFRATPIVVYAIILAAMVGLGAQTGAMAIAVGSFVMLTKLYAEALESIAAGPVEAVKAAGGNTVQTFVYAMLPQVFPGFVATTLYAFELNLQSSFILGFVGAGGIGYDLLNYIRVFQWRQVCTILIITILVVNAVDFISYRIRSAIS